MSSGEPSAQPEQIGKYRIVGTLGQGAMGRVYLGEDPHIGRKVAVKVLSGATGDEARARFLEEARTIGHLSHPEIVTLLEFGFHEGQPFLAMEHLEGESFARWLARRPAEAAVLRVLAALCRAIDHAHAQGVLHRDVKPSNVQVLEDGRAKLLDFGIARAGSVALTATGMLMGTPQYLAPEVLEGKGHSTASDVYAVGLVAYEALTGRNPFAADTLEHCLTRVLTATPERLAALRPDLEPELAGAVQACLARRPADRPATLEPLRRALEARMATGSDSLAQPTVRLQRGAGAASTTEGSGVRSGAAGTGTSRDASGRWLPRWSRWTLGAIALLAAAGVLAWMLAGPAGPEQDEVAAGPGTTSTPPDRAVAGGDTEGSIPLDATRRIDHRLDRAAGTPEAAGPPAPSREPEVTAARERSPAEAGTERSDAASDRRARTGGDGAAPAGTPGRVEAQPVSDRPDPGAGTGTGTDRSTESASTETMGKAPSQPDPRATTPPASASGPETLPHDANGARQGEAGGGQREATARPDDPDRGPGAVSDHEDETAGSVTEPPTAPPGRDPTAAADEPSPELPAPRLDRLTPAVVRRGGVAAVVLDGAAFADGVAVEVRRGDTPVPGIRVRRLAVRDDGRIRLTLFVAPDVPLGLYSVVVVAPDGRTSNPTELEVTL